MQTVNAAWACLGDPERRARYDECGKDSPGLTIEEQAHELLFNVLRRALDDATDALAQAWHELRMIKENASHIIMRNISSTASLKRRRVAITAKGENLVHDLIDAKLGELSAQTAAAQHMLKVHEKAAVMLAAYSSTEGVVVTTMTAGNQVFMTGFSGIRMR